MHSALPGMHFLTGCDTVSAFGGKGKINALKLVQKNKKYQETFTKLCKEWLMTTDLFNMLKEFTCKLYANKCPSTNVNELQCQLFKAKKKKSNQDSCPLVKIAFSCVVYALTINLEYGTGLLNSLL